MAIKVLGVPGEKLLPDERGTADFILLNYPLFPFATAADYVAFMANPVAFRAAHPETVEMFGAIEGQKIDSLLDVTWHSTTPYRLGPDRIVRYALAPDTPARAVDLVPTTGPDRFRLDLLRRLGASNDGGASFTLFVQERPASMQTDDPRVPWPLASDEASRGAGATPRQACAKLYLSGQDFDNPSRRAFGESLSFSPWHTLAEHEPVGEINLIRRAVYLAVARLRADHAGLASMEPTGDGAERFVATKST
jgi:hypothetical protein